MVIETWNIVAMWVGVSAMWMVESLKQLKERHVDVEGKLQGSTLRCRGCGSKVASCFRGWPSSSIKRDPDLL